MGRISTFRRVALVATVVATLAMSSVVHATEGSGAEGTVPTTVDARAPFRPKNPIALAAVSALSMIMRTENIEDPRYLEARLKVSDLIAKKMSLDAAQLNRAWSRAPRDHQIAMLAALTQLGVRYVVGKESPYVQVDCSGLLWFAWRAAGVDMPRQAVSQLDPRMRVKREKAIAGDVVGEGNHVHIYLGVGRAMVHAPFNGKSVRLKMMSQAQFDRVAWANPSNIATYRL
jgi:NlpC/P60 family